MNELEITARELILAITEKTLKTLKANGLLKEPSKLQMLCSSPEMKSLIKKLAPPKYDPNREFCEGDKVSVRKIHGKLPQCRYNGMVKVKEGDYCTIHEKEHRNCYWVTIPSGGNWCFDAAYLELVTPVEELGPYVVRHNEVHSAWSIYGPFNLSATNYFYGERYPYTKETAKEAAEAECARLNAEYRKEQDND